MGAGGVLAIELGAAMTVSAAEEQLVGPALRRLNTPPAQAMVRRLGHPGAEGTTLPRPGDSPNGNEYGRPDTATTKQYIASRLRFVNFPLWLRSGPRHIGVVARLPPGHDQLRRRPLSPVVAGAPPRC